MKCWQPCFVVVLSSLYFTSADIFSAMDDLEKMLKTHEIVINDLQDYINQEKLRISGLERILAVYQREQEKAMQDSDNYLGNPINLFRLLKRLTIDLDTFRDQLENTTVYIRNNTVKHPDILYPTTEDLKGAAKAMVLLVKTYRLNITELAEGTLVSGVFSNPMSSDDCYELARNLFMGKHYNDALPWFLEALRKYRGGDQGYHFTELNILEHIVLSNIYNDDAMAAMEWLMKLLALAPDFLKSIGVFDKLLSAAREKANLVHPIKTDVGDVDEVKYDVNGTNIISRYESLCRGEVKLKSDMIKRLSCWYSTKHHPFLKLAPIKVEQVYLEPDVFVFHQVISDHEIQHVKELARGKLQRAKVLGGVNGTFKTSADRISKISWLEDNSSPIVARITQRIADMTGLAMDTAEELQIANYGIGGHYLPHRDFALELRRVATVLFYMSEVAQGGATVFIELGLSVFPIKNAALFWFNMHPHYMFPYWNWNSLHAACPVLKGSKWSANKWIRIEGQMFAFPCLKQDNSVLNKTRPLFP